MKVKKILLITLIALAVIIGNVKFVYATDSFSVKMNASSTSYARGDTVIITVTLSDINSTNGIYGLEGKLEYKTDIFEEIVTDSSRNTTQITSLNGWGSATFNSETKEFAIMTVLPAKSTQNIMQIALKIKEDAPLGTASIMLKNLIGSNAGEDIETSPATASITIKDESEIIGGEIPVITTTPSPESTPSTNVTTTPSSSSSQITVSSPKATQTPNASTLPKTGIEDNPVPILFGALIICLGAYIAYRRYKDI